MPEYEHDEYEMNEHAEYAAAPEALHEYEPVNDDAPEAEADTIDARLGGEKDEWRAEDRGESGYLFDGRDVIGPDGTSWLAAWGESAENIALYDEMVMWFGAGETSFQLPDHTEYRDDGETLYKTFMLLNEDGSVGYEIHTHERAYANDDEPLLFDDEDEADDERDPIAMNDNAPEPTASDMPEAVTNEARAAEAAFTFATDAAAPVAEYAPVIEQAVAEATAQEMPAYAEESRMQEEHDALAARETPAYVTELLASVTYHAETAPEVAGSVEATTVVEPAPQTETLREETAPEMTPTVVEHRHATRDILDIIPNLPTYANRDMEPLSAVAPEMRAEAASIPPAILTEAAILAAEVATAPERTAAAPAQTTEAPRSTGPKAEPMLSRETPARSREQITARIVAPKTEQRMIRPTESKRETPHTMHRFQTAPRMGETARNIAERPRREAARPARTETRVATPETAHPLARIMRGRETVHPTRQAVNARRFAHADTMNDNAIPPAQSATLHGITLYRAA